MRPESGRMHNFRHNENPTLCPGDHASVRLPGVLHTNVGHSKFGYSTVLKNSYDLT